MLLLCLELFCSKTKPFFHSFRGPRFCFLKNLMRVFFFFVFFTLTFFRSQLFLKFKKVQSREFPKKKMVQSQNLLANEIQPKTQTFTLFRKTRCSKSSSRNHWFDACSNFRKQQVIHLGRTAIIVCETRHPLKVEMTVQMSRKQRSLFFPILRHTKKNNRRISLSFGFKAP